MAIVCGLFNDDNGKNEYADTEMAVLYSILKHDKGVVVGEGDELKVTLGTGLEVKVGTGAAWIGEPCGWFIKNDAEVFLPIDTEVEGYKRSDRVILKLDRNISSLDITIQVKKGSPAASEPVAPELEQNSMVYEIPLANVVVTGGANTIDLIDERGLGSENVYKTTHFTVQTADRNCFIRVNSAVGVTLTVPTHAYDPIPVGSDITVVQEGTGQITIASTSGVVIRSVDSNLISDGQYSAFTLRKIDEDTWYAIGALTS